LWHFSKALGPDNLASYNQLMMKIKRHITLSLALASTLTLAAVQTSAQPTATENPSTAAPAPVVPLLSPETQAAPGNDTGQPPAPENDAAATAYDIQEGLQAFEAQDYEGALANFTDGAMKGHALAQFNLALMYHNGIGTEADYERAMQLYALAAQQGMASAQFNLALMYDRGEGVERDFDEAYYWYMQAAEQGDASGQYAIGTMNFYGQGRPTDYEEAIRWYQEAARQGHRDAQYNLGVMHLSGMGTEEDPVVALTWFTMAADNGSADAQYNAALMFAAGSGTEQDLDKAVEYLEMAGEQGLRDAQTRLGMLYVSTNTPEFPRDYEKARHWFNESAHQGDPLGQFYLGRIYAEGLGVEQSDKIGHMWYEIAMRFGHPAGREYMLDLRTRMTSAEVEEAEVMSLRWMIAYAVRNPGELQLRQETQDGRPQEAPEDQQDNGAGATPGNNISPQQPQLPAPLIEQPRTAS
jgi:TPR repeat protein